jgi:hypothetical protein
MDKGIRPYCNNKFVELNERRRRGELSNTQFRKNVIADVMEQFGITLASAATHYNHAFKNLKELNAELVSGLGRPEDKKGGRKPKAKAAPDSATVADVLLSNILKARAGNEGDATEGETAEAAPETPAAQTEEPKAAAPAPEVKYSVRKAGDKTVVCGDLTLAEANALIEKAAKAKKAKLELVP